MVYVFCAEWEVRHLRDLVERNSSKKHMISSSVESFMGVRGPVYYTKASVKDNHEQFITLKRYIFWHEDFLPFPVQNYTSLGKFLGGKE